MNSSVLKPRADGDPALTLFAGTASAALAQAIARDLGWQFAAATVDRFPDGEVSVRLDDPVRGQEVILLAATAPPVNDSLMELLAFVDACRRADAARIVAIVPYFGYARSDRRNGHRTPIMAGLVAELAEHAGIDHVVTVDVHTPALEGFFRIPVDNLTAVPLLASTLEPRIADATVPSVVVAPDLGAVRLATRYATMLDLPVAVCHKQRFGAAEVSIGRITGDVHGRHCIIVDDMISTGSTIVEGIRALHEAGAHPGATVVVTHAVLVSGALERLEDSGVRELIVTDTITPKHGEIAGLAPHVVSVAPLLANAIRRIAEGGALHELG